jgi:hypothetical protein
LLSNVAAFVKNDSDSSLDIAYGPVGGNAATFTPAASRTLMQGPMSLKV